MILSRMIEDPEWRKPNKMGRTVGLVFYTPKFWDCRTENWEPRQHWQKFSRRADDPVPQWMVDFCAKEKAAHAACKRRHMSYKGYMYWTGPKHRYYCYYMGQRGIGQKKGIFARRSGDRYIRWF